MTAASGGGGGKFVTDGTQVLQLRLSSTLQNVVFCSKFSYIRLYAPRHHLNFSRSTCLSHIPLAKLSLKKKKEKKK
ncbi:hypothetical protein TorRG33x02_326180 [Trema orientale]|uniref:Uncharacterized protein n=1 Tax=Trema orientale TaxID=63057 RepID=A0A2P5BC55_TREOI|nr:hypothetical protein TorRG33x02_326180 [Trema orientale]